VTSTVTHTDLVIGAMREHHIAYGVRKTVADSIAAIDDDAHPTDLGVALSANTNALLNVVSNAT
jgi:hypothetical protein